MPGQVQCDNCGEMVSKRYARVMSPRVNPTSVECCPHCPDMLWDGNGPREAKSDRNQT